MSEFFAVVAVLAVCCFGINSCAEKSQQREWDNERHNLELQHKSEELRSCLMGGNTPEVCKTLSESAPAQ